MEDFEVNHDQNLMNLISKFINNRIVIGEITIHEYMDWITIYDIMGKGFT